jgi:hypothetical protein
MSLPVVTGSGETVPTMVRIHRQVFAETAGHRSGPAVMLDTPFGFQLNADDLVRRARRYFAGSVGIAIDVAKWRSADQPAVECERAPALLQRAGWAFAGPGSPTYALRRWRGTGVPETLPDVASHDTRYCYRGEQRLMVMEAHPPDEIGVLGADEHTALLVDVETRTARVAGHGVVTVRRRERSLTFPADTELGLDRLDALLPGTATTHDGPVPACTGDTPGSGAASAAGTTGQKGAGQKRAGQKRAA